MRKLHGVVVSDKMNRTVVVRVDTLTRHSKYQKYVRRSRRFKADTGGGAYRTGDEVVIQETRPLSREKRWEVIALAKKVMTEADSVEEDMENQEARIANQGT